MKNLSYLAAAERVLRDEGHALHYREITERAIKQGILVVEAQEPAYTLNALINIDIRKRASRGDPQRFTHPETAMYGLAEWQPQELTNEIDDHNRKVRAELLERAKAGDPEEFEQLIGTLLAEMGFDDVEVTRHKKDGGLDVLGTLVIDDVMRIRMAVQAKRWKNNVRSPDVQALRGSLVKRKIGYGLIITTSDFSKGAREEARDASYPIELVNGENLARLLAEHEVGVEREQHTLFRLLDLETDATDS